MSPPSSRSKPPAWQPAFAKLALGLALAVAGIAQSPQLIRDVNPAPGVGSLGGVLGRGPIDGEVLLALDDGVSGSELWRTDGTAAGTRRVFDFVPGPGGSILSHIVTLADLTVVVVDRGNGYELWRTDGTTAGTFLLFPSPSPASFLIVDIPPVAHGNVLFFSNGVTTWRTDGTVAGTWSLGVPWASPLGQWFGLTLLHSPLGSVIVSDGNTAAVIGNVPGSLTLHSEGRLLQQQPVFSLPALTTTFTALHLPSAPSASVLGFARALPVPGAFLLTAANGLLRWDGAGPPQTLRAVSTFGPRFLQFGTKWVFTATEPATGAEVWITDGTVAGTMPIDTVPGPQGSSPELAVALANSVVFWATAGGLGAEPFRTDGTTAGTFRLGDLQPGAGSSSVGGAGYMAGGERRALLAVQTSALGKEMWITDGTIAGTMLVADIAPGPASSQITPGGFFGGLGRVCGDAFVWTADDTVHGREPWILPLPGTRTELQRYGTRRFDVGDPVLGTTMDLRGTNLEASDIGVIALGAPIGRCLPLAPRRCLHFDPGSAIPIAVVVPGPTGQWNGSLLLPNQPAAVGLELAMQPLFLPAGLPLDVGDAHWLSLGF